MLMQPAAMHEGDDFQTAKEIIDFALKVNAGLRLGGNVAMSH